MYCQNCRKEVFGKYCSNCGTRVAVNKVSEPDTNWITEKDVTKLIK